MGRLKVDPWGPACALVALVVFLVHGFGGVLSRDLALYAYAGQQAADGVAPYVGVLNRAGPLAHLVPAIGVLGARLVGGDELMGMRTLMMLASIACVWLLYVLGRDLFRSVLAGVTSAVALLTFEGFVLYATGGPREKTAMLLFVICALLAITRQRWATAGAFIALATLTWQPAFTLGVAAAVFGAIALEKRRAFPALVRFAVGGLVPTGLCVLVFVVWGALPELVEGFVSVNASYTDQTGLREALADGPGLITEGFGDSFWLVVVGLALVEVVALLTLLPAGRRRELAEPGILAVAGGGLGLGLWSLRAFNGWGDLVAFLPVAALGFGAGVSLLRRALLPRHDRIAVGITLVAVAAGLVVAGRTAATTRTDELAEQRADVEAMFALAPDDATVVSVGGPQPLVLTGRTNPFRHQMFLTGLNTYVDDTWPGGIEGFADEIEAERPTFITMDEPGYYRWLSAVIERDYVEVGRSPSFTWFVHRDVGTETIEEMKSAL